VHQDRGHAHIWSVSIVFRTVVETHLYAAPLGAGTQTWTFEGHETLTMAGRSFPNACRFKVVNDAQPSFGTTVVWAAPGYGPIQYKFIDVDGTVRGVRTLASVTEP